MTEKEMEYQLELKERLIQEWKDLEGTEFLDVLTKEATVDPEFYEHVMKKVSQAVKPSKAVFHSSNQTMKKMAKSTKHTKKYYYKVSKSLAKLLKRDDVAHELKLELIELLKELALKVERCDERSQALLKEHHKKAMEYGTLALVTVAAICGVMKSQSALSKKENESR